MKTKVRLALNKLTFSATILVLHCLAFYLLINDYDVAAGLTMGISILTGIVVALRQDTFKKSLRIYLTGTIPFPLIYVFLLFGIMLLQSLKTGKSEFTLDHISITLHAVAPIYMVLFAATAPLFAGSFATKVMLNKIKTKK